jgi:predicted nicotinamide N-methyase
MLVLATWTGTIDFRAATRSVSPVDHHHSSRLRPCHRKDGLVQEFRGYPVIVTRFDLAGRRFKLLGPANYDELLDLPEVARRFRQNEYMPYWAQLWPAGVLLAETVAQWPPAGDNPPSVLEIGCGLGLASLVMSHLGCRVLATDQDADALAFLAESARRNRLPVPETRLLDWQKDGLGMTFDRIVASDVLYETRHLRPVAEFVHDHLEPDGFGLVVDPNRFTADEFETIARHCDLAVRVTQVEVADRAPDKPVRGRVFQLRRRA